MKRRLASGGAVLVSFAAAIGTIGVTIWSRTGTPSNGALLSAILAALSAILLLLVADKVLMKVGVEDAITELAASLRTPLALSRWRDLTPFDEFVRDADSVLIVGLTKAGGLTEGTERLTALVKSNCRVQILVLRADQPELIALTASATTHTARRLTGDSEQFVETLRAVRRGLTAKENRRLLVRTYACVPTAGVILAKRGNASSAQVYFYPYKTDPADRPALELRGTEGEEWVRYFKERYEQLWDEMLESPDPTVTRPA